MECLSAETFTSCSTFEKLADLDAAPDAAVARLFSIEWQKLINGKKREGCSGLLSAAWQLYIPRGAIQVAKEFGVKLTMFHGRGGTFRVRLLQSFGEEHLCFRTPKRFTAATLEHGMRPPVSPKPEWRALMDEIAVVATEKYRSIVFKEPRFVEYFRLATPELELDFIFQYGSALEQHLRDPGIAALYDVSASEDLWSFGELLRSNYEETKSLLLQIAGHKDLLEGDPHLRQRLRP
ncbi:Phosphoenolpyruvate carboxylase 1 [Datura stramonium]|uniref:Phosphoenolpyruvate carboxylase 1 n=1 Tax=Datura stramonium TaxID=4076 RepID=A0ABS8WEI9_DATST|nr:Phosphoenolpyruvate carboxylase 1 [Datura stramonium]